MALSSRPWTSTLAGLFLSLICLHALAQTQTPTAPASSGAPLDAAIRAASDLSRLRSLLVSRRGDIIVDRYFRGARATTPANLKSASKAVISALVGIAIDRKLIPGVSAPIAPYFPELLGAGADPQKRKITIEDLLTMRSGLESTSIRNYGAWVQSPNWVRFVLTRRLTGQPGVDMIYSTGNYHLLSAILTKASGASTLAFAREALAKPLGIALASWMQDPQGIYFGGNEMVMTPRQMAAFGDLYLRRGLAGGRQIVPAAWVDASFVPRGRSNWSEQLYGYGWWIREMAGRQVCYAWGYGGQFIFIVPDLDLVVVTTSVATPGDERHEHLRAVYDLVERLIVAPMASGS
jgi:CubicO group peptidase (beta-lactamase class C family)